MRRDPPSAAEQAWNPYSWRLRAAAELRDDPALAADARRLVDEALVAEAFELALGIRHVSIVHGDPATLREADQLETFLAQLPALMAGASWWRTRGDHEHVIVAVRGDDAAERAGHVAALVELSNPGHWRITESARPDLGP